MKLSESSWALQWLAKPGSCADSNLHLQVVTSISYLYFRVCDHLQYY